MKAYYVDTKDAEYPEIVFAVSRAKAIVESEAYMETGEWTECRARREPKFDQYADRGQVPKDVLIKNGWWFECGGKTEDGKRCTEIINADTPEPCYRSGRMFCCKACLDRRLG